MMVQDIYLIMKQSVFLKEHGKEVRKFVELKLSQMVMFMKVNSKMECLMVEEYFIIMFNSILIKKFNTSMMGNLSRDKNMVSVKKPTSQGDVMKDIINTIRNMEMVN